MLPVAFLALPGVAILVFVRSCVFKNSSAQQSWEEETTAEEGLHDHSKFGNRWVRASLIQTTPLYFLFHLIFFLFKFKEWAKEW